MMEELRDAAFHVWYRNGRNIQRMREMLEKMDYVPPTRQTLYKWRDADNWEERAVTLDAKRQAAFDAQALSIDERVLTRINDRIDEYDEYFKAHSDKPDAQRTFAYTGLEKLAYDLAQASLSYRRGVFGEFYEDIKEFFGVHNPVVAEAIEDAAATYIKHIEEKIGT